MDGANAVGIYRNGKFYQVRSDHMGTPRLVTDNTNAPVWQWPYSAFGNNRTRGVLTATTTSSGQATLRATKAPVAVNLRFPGQYFDEELSRAFQSDRKRSIDRVPVLGLCVAWMNLPRRPVSN